MANFDISYAPLKEFEGGYTNDPSDAGGETYAGIARNYFPAWEGWEIVDEYKRTVAQNPAALTRALGAVPSLQKLVADWYRKEWWDRLGLAALPQKMADEIFEQSVNLGKSGCGKKIQTVCNAYNYGPGGSHYFPDLKIDNAQRPCHSHGEKDKCGCSGACLQLHARSALPGAGGFQAQPAQIYGRLDEPHPL